MNVPKVIGEGTYGCVLRPSLKCKEDIDIPYNERVSKILSLSDSKKELSEYNNIESVDAKNEFYLGKPVSCKIKNTLFSNLKAIQSCKIGSEVLKKMDKYSLIIMKDGGHSLDEYVEIMGTWAASPENTKKCELFLLDSLRLFKGILIFKKNDLIHHDLKPQNIVYNEESNRLNFIDADAQIVVEPRRDPIVADRCPRRSAAGKSNSLADRN